MLAFDASVSLTSVPCVSVSLLAVVCLYLVNRAQGGNLNYSAKQRERMKLSHPE